MLKWIAVLVILAASLAMSGVMLQAMGMVDFGRIALEALDSVPAAREAVAVYRLGLDAERALAEERRHVALLQAELSNELLKIEDARAELALRAAELDRREAELDQRERRLDAEEASLQSRTAKLGDFERLRSILAEMRPADVVPILDQLEDQLVAALLSRIDERRAGQILAELDPARAAAITRHIGGLSTK